MEYSYYHCPVLRFGVTIFIPTLLVGYAGAHSYSSSSGNYNPCNFPAIFNFGDSNSDTGALKVLMTGEKLGTTICTCMYTCSRGRYFWIHNTGPVGCLAYMINSLQIDPGKIDEVGCVKPINEVALYFNRRLNDTVVKLRKQLPSAAITYVDVYKVKYLLISKAKKYGFIQPLKACCGRGGKYNYNSKYGCGAKMKGNGKEIFIRSCKNPKVKIVWDGVHYTEAANKFVFDQIVDGSFSDPPMPLTLACHRPTSH
ncbi:hypothetical protein MKX03_022288 [Papaver bracteatum]|nr:hypothetical protein MKX03_022288 [Papaver bracteatum]